MRSLLPLLALGLVGCTDPLSCESLDARQDADAARTCVAAASLEDAPVTVALADGTPLTVDALPSLTAYRTFADGVRIAGTADGVIWLGDGQERTDSLGVTAGAAAAPVGDRYAVPLADGRLLLRSRDGSDPVDLPIEIEMRRIGSWEGPLDIRMAFSADGQRFAAVDGSRTAFVVDARTGERLWEAALDTTVSAVALSADGARVAIALRDRTARVWEVASGAEVGTWSHPRPLGDVTFASDGSLLTWLSERTSTRRQRTGPRTSGGATQSTTVSTTTPPAVVVWRLP